MKPQTIHLVCSCQLHTCSNISDRQINIASESLSASANYLRKLVEGQSITSSESKTQEKENPNVKKENSTFSIHADSSYSDSLKGFTEYDSESIDAENYKSKRHAYDLVRKKYPNLDNLIRNDRVQALKELKSVGFRYYSIRVTAFVKVGSVTRTVSSKSHHRLDRPPKDYLEYILKTFFKAIIRSDGSKIETSEENNVSKDEINKISSHTTNVPLRDTNEDERRNDLTDNEIFYDNISVNDDPIFKDIHIDI